MVRRHWLTALSVLLGVFLVGLGVLGAFGSDQSAGERVLFVAVFGLAGAVLLGGLWLLRRRGPTTLAYVMVVIGLLAAGLWWWMLLPTIVALVVLVFGVIRGGLARELRRS